MIKYFLEKLIVLFRLMLVIAALILFVWLVRKDMVLSGVLIIKNDFGVKDRQISDLTPPARVRAPAQRLDGDWYQEMIVDPVYFYINPPRDFERVTVRIKYKTERQPLFQFGVKAGAGDLDFLLETAEFVKLDNLAWPKIRQGDLVLYQKNQKYKGLEEFLNNLPKDGRIALHNYDLKAGDKSQYLLTILNAKTDLSHVSYILAKYNEPKIEGAWKVNEIIFPISRANIFEGKLVFMLSAPELDINKGEIDISEIQATFSRQKFDKARLFSEMGAYLKEAFD